MGPTPTLHYPIWAWGGHEVVLVLPQPRATLCHSDKGCTSGRTVESVSVPIGVPQSPLLP